LSTALLIAILGVLLGALQDLGPCLGDASGIERRLWVVLDHQLHRPRRICIDEQLGQLPGFQSLLTFHEGGTLTEVSSELGLGLRGLGHGGWTRSGQDYTATFQVWVFNPDTGVAEGRIQVRAAIRIDKNNVMTADIDSGPFEATPVEAVGL
jgi:hypothetical protein